MPGNKQIGIDKGKLSYSANKVENQMNIPFAQSLSKAGKNGYALCD